MQPWNKRIKAEQIAGTKTLGTTFSAEYTKATTRMPDITHWEDTYFRRSDCMDFEEMIVKPFYKVEGGGSVNQITPWYKGNKDNQYSKLQATWKYLTTPISPEGTSPSLQTKHNLPRISAISLRKYYLNGLRCSRRFALAILLAGLHLLCILSCMDNHPHRT